MFVLMRVRNATLVARLGKVKSFPTVPSYARDRGDRAVQCEDQGSSAAVTWTYSADKKKARAALATLASLSPCDEAG